VATELKAPVYFLQYRQPGTINRTTVKTQSTKKLRGSQDFVVIGHVRVLEVLVGDFQQGVGGPFRKPVDGSAVHESWVLTHPVPTATTVPTTNYIITISPTRMKPNDATNQHPNCNPPTKIPATIKIAGSKAYVWG